jgi:hypothetical protein
VRVYLFPFPDEQACPMQSRKERIQLARCEARQLHEFIRVAGLGWVSEELPQELRHRDRHPDIRHGKNFT